MTSRFRKQAGLTIGLVLGLAACLGGGSGGVRAWADDRASLTVADVEAAMTGADPGHFLATLKNAFPDDYKNMLDQVLAAVKSGAGSDDIRRLTQSITSDIRHRHAGNVASATLPKLDQLVEAQSVVLHLLQERKAAACGNYFVKGATDELAAMMAEPALLSAVSAQASATFEAIADGEGRPKADPFENSDATAIVAGLTGGGVSPTEANAVLKGTLASVASSERSCEVGLKFVEVLQALPDDSRRRVLATALASAVGN
jgi:hypothetical protein